MSAPVAASGRSALRQQNLPAVDGLRTTAALLVVAFHAGHGIWPFDVGSLGVPIFFVLSGYLITRLSRAEETSGGFSFRGFWIRRVTRIVPLYFVALAAFSTRPFIDGGGGGSTLAAQLPLYLTFNGEFIPDGGYMEIAWSLGIEEKFYLIWPVVVFLLLAGTRARARLPLAFVAGCLCLALSVVVGQEKILPGYGALLLGAGLALFEDRRGWSTEGNAPFTAPAWGWLFAAATVAVLLLSDLMPRAVHLVLAPLVCLLLIHVVHGRSAVRTLLSTAPARWLGRRSYGIYLFHLLVLIVLTKLAPSGLVARQLIIGLACLVVTFVVADLAHRWVEKPAIKLGRRWAADRKTPRQVKDRA